MKALIIEDDKVTGEFIESRFKQAGYATVRATDGLSGAQKAITEPFDIMIVDIMLPGIDGFEVIRRTRAAHVNTPIIVLSARDSEDSKIRGLEYGADDYQAKPFSLSELLARAAAQIRRATATAEPTELTVADLHLDLRTRKVTRGGKRIILQPLEFQLLEFLMRNTGRVVSRTTILEHVWEYNFDPHTNVVDSRISHLRDKIDRDFEHKLISTVRGFGYVLE
jgi:two-component system, OmpR family, response regulator